MILPPQKLYWWPIAADFLAILLVVTLFAPLEQLFAQRTAQGWAVVAAVYLFFCLAINGLRKLQPVAAERPAWLTQFNVLGRTGGWVVGLGLVMALTVILIQADLNQLAESTQIVVQNPELHEGEVTLYYAFGPALMWIALGLFYVLVLVTKVDVRHAPTTVRYGLTYFWSALLTDSLMLVLSAYFASLWARQAWAVTAVLPFLGLLLLYTILFDPLRLLHAEKTGQWWPLLTYSIFVLLCLTTAVV